MIILTIRTDKPESELGLYDSSEQLGYVKWEAHRQLAETLHTKIKDLLSSQNVTWHDVQGVVVYEGPGSFSGLRIGLAVANALSDGGRLPIVAVTGEEWINAGIKMLLSGENHDVALPEYGSPVHITQQKK